MGNNGDRTLNDAVADALRAERAVAHLTVRELAALSGVPERTLIRLLMGERDINVDQIFKLAKAMGKSPAYIMSEAERRMGHTGPQNNRETGTH